MLETAAKGNDRMVGAVTNELLYDILKQIQADISAMKATQADHSRQLIEIRKDLIGMRADIIRLEERVAHCETRLDRIETRLNLVDA